MESICKLFGRVFIILGLISSFMIAKNFGVSMSNQFIGLERDWGLTILLFVSCAFCSTILGVILLGLAEVLQNQRIIAGRINEVENNLNTVKKETVTKLSAGSWRCKRCNKINEKYIGTCSCGEVAPD